MPKPEGYRKALRLMELAGRFGPDRPRFIDTTGAYPGVDAEERGQAEAIAKNLEVMSALPVPILAAVIGEGGSGGALALGVADRILMLEYSVSLGHLARGMCLHPVARRRQEGRSGGGHETTARDLQRLGVVDEVVREGLEAPIATSRPRPATSARPCAGTWPSSGRCRPSGWSSCATKNTEPWAPSSNRAWPRPFDG